MLYLSANSQERQQLQSLYAEVSSPVRAPRVGEVVAAFAALTDSFTRASVDAVVQSALHLSAELIRPVPVTLSRLKLSAVAVMIELGPFNKAQRVVLKKLLSSPPANQPEPASASASAPAPASAPAEPAATPTDAARRGLNSGGEPPARVGL